jgi:flagellar biogenesis protein FliO
VSGVTRHPRLPQPRPAQPQPSALANVVTMLVSLGMALGLVLLLAAYVGVIS